MDYERGGGEVVVEAGSTGLAIARYSRYLLRG